MGDGHEREALWTLTHVGSVEQAAGLQARLEACLGERDRLQSDLLRVLAERDAVAQDRETLARVAWRCRTAQREFADARDQGRYIVMKRCEARLDQQLVRFPQPEDDDRQT